MLADFNTLQYPIKKTSMNELLLIAYLLVLKLESCLAIINHSLTC
jgi:hypothetical protein